jgi:hypothetical protein
MWYYASTISSLSTSEAVNWSSPDGPQPYASARATAKKPALHHNNRSLEEEK